MKVVSLFDRRPFTAYREAGQDRATVQFLETVLPRVAELQEITGIQEWWDLADQAYMLWVSEKISKSPPELIQTGGPDLHEGARERWRNILRPCLAGDTSIPALHSRRRL